MPQIVLGKVVSGCLSSRQETGSTVQLRQTEFYLAGTPSGRGADDDGIRLGADHRMKRSGLHRDIL